MRRLVVAALVLVASTAEAQRTPAEISRDRGAFVTETAAGAIGSLAGVGFAYLTAATCSSTLTVDSHDDGNGCALRVGVAGLVATMVGSTIGNHVAVEYTKSPRSGWGALVGSAVGTAFALGTFVALEGMVDDAYHPLIIPIYTISQGAFTAWSSRAFAQRK